MTKVEESILSWQYSFDTCSHLIKAISNVSGEASIAMIFSQTIRRVYNKMKNDTLDAVLIRALLRMTIKAPVLLDSSL